MAQVEGFDPDELEQETDAVEAAVAAGLAAIAAAMVAQALPGLPGIPDVPSLPIVDVDSLSVIPTMWLQHVDDVLMPMADNTVRLSAALVEGDLADAGLDDVPEISDTTVEDILSVARNRLVGIGDDLWENMRTGLVEGVSLGETVPELADRIRAAAAVSEPRARTIARTEVIGASNAASIAQARSAGIEMNKVWLATEDARTREAHEDADGQSVPLNGMFEVGGEMLDFPGDPRGRADNIINCRCAIGYEFTEIVPITAAGREYVRDREGQFAETPEGRAPTVRDLVTKYRDWADAGAISNYPVYEEDEYEDEFGETQDNGYFDDQPSGGGGAVRVFEDGSSHVVSEFVASDGKRRYQPLTEPLTSEDLYAIEEALSDALALDLGDYEDDEGEYLTDELGAVDIFDAGPFRFGVDEQGDIQVRMLEPPPGWDGHGDEWKENHLWDFGPEDADQFRKMALEMASAQQDVESGFEDEEDEPTTASAARDPSLCTCMDGGRNHGKPGPCPGWVDALPESHPRRVARRERAAERTFERMTRDAPRGTRRRREPEADPHEGRRDWQRRVDQLRSRAETLAKVEEQLYKDVDDDQALSHVIAAENRKHDYAADPVMASLLTADVSDRAALRATVRQAAQELGMTRVGGERLVTVRNRFGDFEVERGHYRRGVMQPLGGERIREGEPVDVQAPGFTAVVDGQEVTLVPAVVAKAELGAGETEIGETAMSTTFDGPVVAADRTYVRDDDGRFDDVPSVGGDALDKLKVSGRAPAGWSVKSSREIKSDEYSTVLVAETDSPRGPRVRVGVVLPENKRGWGGGFPDPEKAKRLDEISQRLEDLEQNEDYEEDEEYDRLSQEYSDLDEEGEGDRTTSLSPEQHTQLLSQLDAALQAARANQAKQDGYTEEIDSLEEERAELFDEHGDPENEFQREAEQAFIRQLEQKQKRARIMGDQEAQQRLADQRNRALERLAEYEASRFEGMPPEAVERIRDIETRLQAINNEEQDVMLASGEVGGDFGDKIAFQVWGTDSTGEEFGWSSLKLAALGPGQTFDDAAGNEEAADFDGPDAIARLIKGLGGSPTTAAASPAGNLREYWVHGEGAAKIRWGTDGAFNRCVRQLRKYSEGETEFDTEGLCANMYREATGRWPGSKSKDTALDYGMDLLDDAPCLPCLEPQPGEMWHAVFHTEGMSTGARVWEPGALSWREPPFAFHWEKEAPAHGGTPRVVQVGNVLRVLREGTRLHAWGNIDLESDDGAEVARKLQKGFLRWISMGPGSEKIVYEQVWPANVDASQMGRIEPEQTIFIDYKIGELTTVSVPAQEGGFIEPVGELAREIVTAAGGSWTIEIPDLPPAWWFDKPVDMPKNAAVTVTDEGRIYGYLAPANSGHRSYARNGERKTLAHLPKTDYSRWLKETIVAGGGRVLAGPLTMECMHAPTQGYGQLERRHQYYEDSCSIIGRVNIGEDPDDGARWIAGAMMPGVTAEQFLKFLSSDVSLDQQPHPDIPGVQDFVGILAVPVGGWPKSRTTASVPVTRMEETPDGAVMVASAVPVRHETMGDDLVEQLTIATHDPALCTCMDGGPNHGKRGPCPGWKGKRQTPSVAPKPGTMGKRASVGAQDRSSAVPAFPEGKYSSDVEKIMSGDNDPADKAKKLRNLASNARNVAEMRLANSKGDSAGDKTRRASAKDDLMRADALENMADALEREPSSAGESPEAKRLAERLDQADKMFGSDRSKWTPAQRRKAESMERRLKAARGGEGGLKERAQERREIDRIVGMKQAQFIQYFEDFLNSDKEVTEADERVLRQALEAKGPKVLEALAKELPTTRDNMIGGASHEKLVERIMRGTVGIKMAAQRARRGSTGLEITPEVFASIVGVDLGAVVRNNAAMFATSLGGV